MLFRSASARMLRAELCVQRNNTLNARSGMIQTLAQQPAVASTAAAVDFDGPQQHEVCRSAPPQLGASSPNRLAASSPYKGIEPSEWNVSQRMPCGSVTQYLSDLA